MNTTIAGIEVSKTLWQDFLKFKINAHCMTRGLNLPGNKKVEITRILLA